MDQTQRYPLGEEDRFRVLREGGDQSANLDLQSLDKMQDWRITPPEPDIRGWDIVSSSREKLAQVDTLIASPKTRMVYFLVARIGGLAGIGGKSILVPLDQVRLDHAQHQVILDTGRDTLEHGVEWSESHGADYRQAYLYWAGGEGLHEAMRPARPEFAGVAGGEAPASTETTIPLRSEELTPRREQHRDAISVEKHVETEQRTIDVPVTHTDVEIERRAVSAGERAPVEGDITEGEVRIPVLEDEVHIEKHPVVREEIIVRQHPKTETERHAETIRREVAEVHREGDVDVETKGDVDVREDK